MIQYLIFDFDGVIHNTFHIGYKINQIVNPGISQEQYKDFFNGNLYEKQENLTPVDIDNFFELQETEFEYLMIEEEIKNELIKLKKKYKLFIVTSNSEKTLKKYFERNNLHTLFDEILGIETHKSKVSKFNMLFDKYNITSKECLFITDTLGDLLEASKVNLKSVAVDYGFHDVERLKRGNPYRIISHINEVESILSS